jgi:hypothetical protein
MNRRTYLKKLGLLGTGAAMGKTFLYAHHFPMQDYPLKEAWKSLGKLTREIYVFRYIEPVPHLPKVFIYGDSISIGYTEYTRCALDGQACVYRLHRNGGSSHDFIRNMEALKKTMFKPFIHEGWDFTWDLIHFNVGLHDLKYVFDGKLDRVNGRQVTSIPDYMENLEKIILYLKKTWPAAKLVFATTTPVPVGEPGRIQGDDNNYNSAALKVLKGYPDVGVNDLHSFIIPDFSELAIKPGNVHFSREGSRKLGKRVAEVIAGELNIRTHDIPDEQVLKQREKDYLDSLDNS